jgi:SHS family lactate transporter-like MFS transporter
MHAWWREPSRAQWIAFGAAWTGWVLDAFDFTIFMLVMPHVARDLGASTVAATGSIALTLLARLVGGFVAGAAADRWGRKLPLLVSIVWFAVCDGAVALAPTFGWVLVLRTLFGFGMGAEWTSGTTLAMESWPEKSRGIASGILQGSWAIGYLAAAAASAFVLPVWGWRGLFVLAALPALLVLPMRAAIPESDEWKRAAARPRAARERAPLGKLAWASAAMALGFGAYYALTALYPTMLHAELGAGDVRTAWLVALFNVGMLLGSVAAGALAVKRGPYVTIAVFALAAVPVLPLYLGAAPALLPAGAFVAGAVGAGFCGVTPLLLTSLFPAKSRARMVGIAYHLGAFFAAYVPLAIAFASSTWGASLARCIGVATAAFDVALVLLVASRALRRDAAAQPYPALGSES